MLIDMLSLANPSAFSRATRISRHVKKMAKRLNVGHIWQFRMAAVLSQIGCMTLSPDTIRRIHRGEEVSPEERDAFNRHPKVGYELIRGIPNLKEVAEIMVRQQSLQTETDEPGSTGEPNAETGARL